METPIQRLLDDGLKSRKLWVCLFSMLLIFVGALLSSKIPPLQQLYSQMVTGILSAATLYCGANLGHHYINNQAPQASNEAPPVSPPQITPAPSAHGG